MVGLEESTQLQAPYRELILYSDKYCFQLD